MSSSNTSRIIKLATPASAAKKTYFYSYKKTQNIIDTSIAEALANWGKDEESTIGETSIPAGNSTIANIDANETKGIEIPEGMLCKICYNVTMKANGSIKTLRMVVEGINIDGTVHYTSAVESEGNIIVTDENDINAETLWYKVKLDVDPFEKNKVVLKIHNNNLNEANSITAYVSTKVNNIELIKNNINNNA